MAASDPLLDPVDVKWFLSKATAPEEVEDACRLLFKRWDLECFYWDARETLEDYFDG